MRHRPIWALLAALLCVGTSRAADDPPIGKFGSLEATAPEAAKAKALAWLKEVGKSDAVSLKQFDAIWADPQRTLVDRIADTFSLGNEQAAALLREARDATSNAPVRVPDLVKDAKQSGFFRAKLSMAFARNLSNRKVYEEGLDALKLFAPEQVVDPAAYLFHRAVSEHALLQKEQATKTIHRMLDDALDIAPERYKAVAALMLLDMATWKDKDLNTIARKMDNISRRLDLARGGPETQRQQKEVVARLDEIIKKLENDAKKGGGA